MCTVTYMPTGDGCIITSSRDENVLRPKAMMPGVYGHNGINIVYPKDIKAHGSWIAFTETGNAAVLLNGAFTKHISQPPYHKSRGLVFLDIISQPRPGSYFSKMSLENIEPFTLVLFLDGLLFEARWDGKQKHFIQLNKSIPHIWSSATLYNPVIINKRRQWFEKWLSQSPSPTPASLFNFHRFAGDGDSASNVLMNRDNKMLTVSITGMHITGTNASMQHFDLAENTNTLTSLQLTTIPVLTSTIHHA